MGTTELYPAQGAFLDLSLFLDDKNKTQALHSTHELQPHPQDGHFLRAFQCSVSGPKLQLSSVHRVRGGEGTKQEGKRSREDLLSEGLKTEKSCPAMVGVHWAESEGSPQVSLSPSSHRTLGLIYLLPQRLTGQTSISGGLMLITIASVIQ